MVCPLAKILQECEYSFLLQLGFSSIQANYFIILIIVIEFLFSRVALGMLLFYGFLLLLANRPSLSWHGLYN